MSYRLGTLRRVTPERAAANIQIAQNCTVDAGDGDHDHRGGGGLHDVLKLRPRAQHPHARHPQAMRVRVVVEEPDGTVGVLRVGEHESQHLNAGVAGTEDQGAVALANVGGEAFPPHPKGKPSGQHPEDGQSGGDRGRGPETYSRFRTSATAL